MSGSGRYQSAVDRATADLARAVMLPPPIFGPPQKRCPGCDQVWRGFDGDHRSVCCDQTGTTLRQQSATASDQR